MTSQQSERQLTELCRAIESWRRQTKKLTIGMPSELWVDATRLAKRIGVGRAAKALKIEHGKLKRLVGQQTPDGELACLPRQRKTTPPPQVAVAKSTFVEIPSATVTKSFNTPLSCLLEVELPNGRGRLRARLDNATTLDVATILREFAG